MSAALEFKDVDILFTTSGRNAASCCARRLPHSMAAPRAATFRTGTA